MPKGIAGAIALGGAYEKKTKRLTLPKRWRWGTGPGQWNLCDQRCRRRDR
ncbi:hypothetical protein HORIV_35380 [Vreelandella olivaria]|uniref:Uncharacterized protein n=1 Tax=Vreelandella olivaria TaxID=390919 RepID=A0ABN5WW69_9GAMM|nr:hypothetical protein HORIV_35380 [Halomonas olivaria]